MGLSSRFIATRVFNVRLLYADAFSKWLHWLAQTNVITMKTQTENVAIRLYSDYFFLLSSFLQDDILPPMSLLSHQRSFVYDDMQELMKKRDTLGSDEGLVEGDMPEEYLMEDFDYLVSILITNYIWTESKSFTIVKIRKIIVICKTV